MDSHGSRRKSSRTVAASSRKKRKEWCKNNGAEPLFAHPYYPQDRGKAKRTIRNLAEEFLNLLRKFP